MHMSDHGGHTGAASHIWQVIDWAKTTRGGRQYDLLADAGRADNGMRIRLWAVRMIGRIDKQWKPVDLRRYWRMSGGCSTIADRVHRESAVEESLNCADRHVACFPSNSQRR
jgi:hypothetical protein